MKLSIARSELLDALGVVSKSMSSRSTLPILSGILLETTGGLLTLQATDLEISIKRSSPALVESEGSVVVPGRLLTDIVRSLPDAAVTLETDGDRILVRCQQSSFTVKTMNASDFPKFPEVAVDKAITIPSSILSSMVKKVSRAVSRDETRAVLTGVLFLIDGARIRMVATDSYRLAIEETLLSEPVEQDVEVIIPGRALEEASKISSDDTVRIGVSENQVVFEASDTTFICRRIEGSFPNYKQLIPQHSDEDTTVVVVTDELAAAVKRVSLLAMHNTPLKVTINVEDQTLSLSANTQDVGDASEDLMVKVEGKDVEIAFNHAFMTDGLNAVSTETVSLHVQSAIKPGLIESGEGEDFRYLLMPVRLG